MSESISQINFPPPLQVYEPSPSPLQARSAPLHNFDIEDKAIISSQAKILNELEKYNKGDSDEVSLALTTLTNKHQIEAEINVINKKSEILKSIMNMGNSES